ncbi:hypothetical protein ACISU4_28395 [Streptomyces wuyuanensis]|uniref:hypothetical protein n=1 Tax=Streptomyces wuyuanensis TaxID=1196353 RepID=UPI00382F82E9
MFSNNRSITTTAHCAADVVADLDPLRIQLPAVVEYAHARSMKHRGTRDHSSLSPEIFDPAIGGLLPAVAAVRVASRHAPDAVRTAPHIGCRRGLGRLGRRWCCFLPVGRKQHAGDLRRLPGSITFAGQDAEDGSAFREAQDLDFDCRPVCATRHRP